MSSNRLTNEQKAWVESRLSLLDFVEWDRFTKGDWGGLHLAIYGWIGREDDHEDFVVLDLWPKEQTVRFVTSSSEYTEEIYRRLWPDEDVEDHDDCRRIEHEFAAVDNAVELEKDHSLGEFA